jgi:hypothetical protein
MFGIGMGPTGGEKSAYNKMVSSSDFATGVGEGDITASSKFMSDILSGDPTRIATTLAPQISTAQTQAQQAKGTAAQFGTRSGGTTGAMMGIDAATRANITDLIGQLTGGAASGLASMGQNLLSTGMTGTGQAFDMSKIMQDQNMAKWNDIMGSIASVAAAPFTGGASLGMGKFSLPGAGKGINPSTFNSLVTSGTVQPASVDTSSLFA